MQHTGAEFVIISGNTITSHFTCPTISWLPFHAVNLPRVFSHRRHALNQVLHYQKQVSSASIIHVLNNRTIRPRTNQLHRPTEKHNLMKPFTARFNHGANHNKFMSTSGRVISFKNEIGCQRSGSVTCVSLSP